jgi:heme A synthase
MTANFFQGAVAMGCLAIGLFFLRFWRQSRDRLFLWFGIAFWILSLSYILLGTMTFATEWRISVFMLRLVAFCVILYGIYVKNRS